MKTLTASFFTTLSGFQARRCLLYLWPGNWLFLKHGRKIAELEAKMAGLAGVKYAHAFYNARGALYFGLKSLNIGKGDEIIIQAYTCVSVPNAIMALGAKPVYADISLADLNIDPDSIREKITNRTKAIIVQHTFGLPANMAEIKKIASGHNLYLIEDCAHALGAEYNHKPVGSFGEFAIFSFGRDKVVSSVNGGMLVTNNLDICNRLPKNLNYPPLKEIVKNLFYPLAAGFSRLTYDFLNLGKIIIFASKKFGFIPHITSVEENNLADSRILNYALPNALADLGLQSLKGLETANLHRQELANYYFNKLNHLGIKTVYSQNSNNFNIYLRFCVLTQNRQKIWNYFKNHKIILGNWYDAVISPKSANIAKAGYEPGSCPNAELAAAQTLNLPNHFGISLADADRIIDLLKQSHGN